MDVDSVLQGRCLDMWVEVLWIRHAPFPPIDRWDQETNPHISISSPTPINISQ